jgi:hypothetical protein
MTTHITKTWFDGEKVVTKEIPKSEVYKQDPVAWRYRGNLHEFDPSDWAEGPVTPLYTTPQPKQEHSGFLDSKLNPIKRQWVGLTDEEIDHAAEQSDNYASFIAGVLFAQDKLEEKNGG